MEYEDAYVKFTNTDFSKENLSLDHQLFDSIFRVNGTSPVEILRHLITLKNEDVTLVIGDLELEFPEKYLSRGGLNVIFATSGTTGNPKIISKDLTDLVAGIKQKKSNSERLLKWGLLYDPTKMAGLQVMLSAFIRGEALYCPDATQPISERVSYLLERQVNAISATPSMWRALLQVQEFLKLPLIQITLGGERVERALLETLKSVFPNARITQIYASSELGVVFTVQDGLEGFPLRFLNAENEQSCFLKIDEKGRLKVSRNGQWIDTGDRVELSEERVLFTGRSDQIANVGGVKVDPEKVRLAIMELPEVLAAVVSAVSNPILGQVLVAEVALDKSAEITEIDIKTYLKKRIERAEMPAVIRILDQISLNSNGKSRLSI